MTDEKNEPNFQRGFRTGMNPGELATELKSVMENFRPEVARIAANSLRWEWLMEQCGHLGDGSQTTVTLWQDDATRSCRITIGDREKRVLGTDGSSFESIADEGIAKARKESGNA